MSWSGAVSLQNVALDTAYSLRNLRFPRVTVADYQLSCISDGLVEVDLVIDRSEIKSVKPAGSGAVLTTDIDMAHAMAWPCPIDCHTHLDKGQVWPRSKNTDGSFDGASRVAYRESIGPAFTADVDTRVDFSLRTAYSHGTRAIRSHVDGNSNNFSQVFDQLTELSNTWADRIILQLCPFSDVSDSIEWLSFLATRAAKQPYGVLSSFVYPTPRLDAQLDSVVQLADAKGLALDFHADETLNPESHCLRAIARSVLRNKFDGPVLVGHCCALSVQPAEEVSKTLDLVAAAGIGIVALPLCNAYLMDRHHAQTPRHRGTAPVHEARSRGIEVAIGSDNVRDAFYAYGDLDVPELFRDSIRIMQLDHPIGDWPGTVTSTAAKLIGEPELGTIRNGSQANLVLFEARNWSEFVARPHSSRIVLRSGSMINTTPPEFSELDHLHEFSI
ncbi:MAG: cytosine deaminase [Pseudomonadota bacterium]|nr:cytosine deaminase [Pseudomonadota bacterium]